MKCICLHNYVIKTKTPGVSTTRGGFDTNPITEGRAWITSSRTHALQTWLCVCVLYNIIDKKNILNFKKKITFDFTFDMFLIFLWVDNEDNIWNYHWSFPP